MPASRRSPSRTAFRPSRRPSRRARLLRGPFRTVLAAVTGTAAAALTLAGAPSAAADPAEGRAAAVQHYVALGDSYTSGAGIPEQTDANCARSDRNYPTLSAARIAPATFTDVSCGGATTEHMTTGQGTAPPQFDALKPDTDLVTVGIGGNDIGFGGIVARCVVLGGLFPQGAPCRTSYSLGGTDELAARVRDNAKKIDAVLQGIHARSPDARVLLVGYPDLLPEDGTNCRSVVSLAKGDAPWLRDTEKRLNSMLAERAAAGGAEYVDMYGPTVGHDMCKPVGTRWIEPLTGIDAAGFHPNAAGHQAMTGALLDAVRPMKAAR